MTALVLLVGYPVVVFAIETWLPWVPDTALEVYTATAPYLGFALVFAVLLSVYGMMVLQGVGRVT